jgi:hypothetical protein
MRRYMIKVGNEIYDSAPGGVPNPNALLVELDITATSVDAPHGGAFVRIWGLGLQAISQTRNYYGKTIEVWGGMAAGLPLAKPQQFGLLSKGVVIKAYGQWEGVNQHLDLIFAPGGEPPSAGGPNPMPPKKNIVLSWKKGMPLQNALQATLRVAYPGVDIATNIIQKLIADQDQISFHANLYELGYHVRRLTQQMIGGAYPGISIGFSTGKFDVFDENQGGPTIAFEDMIGSPVWIDPYTIQVKTVMRGDITIKNKITLPNVWVNSSQSGAPVGAYADQQMAFTGDWNINLIRHVGNSRAPSGDAWVSIFDCFSNALSQASSSTSQGGN